MTKSILVLIALCLPLAAQEKAKNIVLFIGDAGGVSTLHAASILGHGEPRQLYIQNMPYIGLSDTSTASQWVSDSAAGATAVVTGTRTHNGVLSQGPDAVRREKDGQPLKTILEYAEERGLATGIVTNMLVLDATPASNYAHVNNRGDFGKIWEQFLNPRFGDGVDVLIGPGLTRIEDEIVEGSLDQALESHDRKLYRSLEEIPEDAERAVALFPARENFDLTEAAAKAISILSRDPDGFYLMVEGDMHTSDVDAGLNRVLELDNIIRNTAERLDDTLVLFTADHSFDVRMLGGLRGQPLIGDSDEGYSTDHKSYRGAAIRMDNTHTGEEVLVAAEGPGSEKVRGYMANTDLFHVMMDALGWEPDAAEE